MAIGKTLLAGIALLLSVAAQAQVEVDTSIRWRWQQILDEQRGDATAHTVRGALQINWQLQPQWLLETELEGVVALNDDYNSLTRYTDTAPIPDPEGLELNRFALSYQSGGNWSATLGRQTLSWADERHLSPVAIWQNDQTFDAITVNYHDGMHWQGQYSYLTGVNRIFGSKAGREDSYPARYPSPYATDRRPATLLGRHQHQSHLLNLTYKPDQGPTLNGFYLQLNNRDAAIQSTRTLGLRLSHTFKPAVLRYEYQLEVARQWNYADNPWHYAANLLTAEFSLQYRSHELAIGLERRGTDNGFTFITPLGDEHRYLGWVDVFSDYQRAAAVRDEFIQYRGRDGKLRWRVLAHQFTAVEGGQA